MGGRGVKLGKMVKGFYERTRVVLPASDWVTFLVDFSFELFVGVGPCRFLWQARNSLLQWVRSEQQREEKKKRCFQLYRNGLSVYVWEAMKIINYFTIQLIFATIHGSHYTFWYYSYLLLLSQLTFTFIYSTFGNKFSVSVK